MSDPLAFLEQTVCDDGSVDVTRCTAKHRQTDKELASDEDADILGLSAEVGPDRQTAGAFLRCSPAEFEVGSDRGYRDVWFNDSAFRLVNIKSFVGCGACEYVDEGTHFPAFRAGPASGVATLRRALNRADDLAGSPARAKRPASVRARNQT